MEGAYGSLSMSYADVSSGIEGGWKKAYGEFSGDCLCGDIGFLLDVRHFGCRARVGDNWRLGVLERGGEVEVEVWRWRLALVESFRYCTVRGARGTGGVIASSLTRWN